MKSHQDIKKYIETFRIMKHTLIKWWQYANWKIHNKTIFLTSECQTDVLENSSLLSWL